MNPTDAPWVGALVSISVVSFCFFLHLELEKKPGAPLVAFLCAVLLEMAIIVAFG